MSKRALITGVTGQDGSYLTEWLTAKGYEVHGVVRRVALEEPEQRLVRIRDVRPQPVLHAASLESLTSLYKVVYDVQPDECYHLAAQSFVAHSFQDEASTLETNIAGTHHVLMALRECAPKAKFYFAASSEMFGKVQEVPQTERTRFHPRSAYGISKVAGYHLTVHYREAHGLHASCGILYNHESPRRGKEFVTRKITSHAAAIAAGLTHELRLGNLQARRDWGHAREYVEAMWLMLQQDQPDDYVIATGQTHSVQEFATLAFACVGLEAVKYIHVDPGLYRPTEVDMLQGDASKAAARLGWQPQTSFEALVREMVEADLAALGEPPRRGRPTKAERATAVAV